MKLRRGTIFKPVLFLLAGAIINVAVAWGCAFLIDAKYASTEKAFRRSDGAVLHQVLNAETAVSSYWQSAYISFHMEIESQVAPSHRLPEWFPSHVEPDDLRQRNNSHSFEAAAFGWPCLICYWCVEKSHDVRYSSGLELKHFPRQYGTRAWAPRVLPTTPLWPGFAINTIFYAAVLWVLFAAPLALRKRRRIKRGQCASCGYLLRGTPHVENCPECGAAA